MSNDLVKVLFLYMCSEILYYELEYYNLKRSIKPLLLEARIFNAFRYRSIVALFIYIFCLPNIVQLM